MTATMKAEFDPAAIAADDVGILTGPQAKQVIAFYKLPKPSAKTKVSELRTLAAAAILAAKEQERERVEAADAASRESAEEAKKEPAVEETPGTDLEPKPIEVLPSPSKWQQLVAMGLYLSKSSLVPKVLQNKPEDVTVILLAANDLGIPITQAVDKIYVIDGKKGMMADLMRSLIRRDGHSITVDPASDHTFATVHGKRADNGDTESATYTIEEAIHAGLCSRNDKGEIVSRSSGGKRKPWETNTTDMLVARASSRLARRLFPDCLLGVSYTPDELGYIDAEDEGRPPRDDEATVTVQERRSELAARASALPDDLKKKLAEEWKKRNFPVRDGRGDFDSLTPGAMGNVAKWLEPLEAEARARDAQDIGGGDVDEAFVVCGHEISDGVTCSLREGHEGDHDPDPSETASEADGESTEGAESAPEAPEAASDPVPASGDRPDPAEADSSSDDGENSEGSETAGSADVGVCRTCGEPSTTVDEKGMEWCADHVPM